jgi:hypothetical protein
MADNDKDGEHHARVDVGSLGGMLWPVPVLAGNAQEEEKQNGRKAQKQRNQCPGQIIVAMYCEHSKNNQH